MAGEFRVNSYQNNWQESSDVLALRDGGFVVVWESYFNEYDDSDVAATYVGAQFFDSNGTPVGSENLLRAVDGAYSGKPAVTQLENGNIVVAWAETLDGPIFTNGTRIMAEVFSAGGVKIGNPFQVDTVASFKAVAPDVVARSDGGFTVSFGTEGSPGGKGDQVYYRSYSESGTPVGTSKILNTKSNQFDESVTKSTALANGNTVVIWNSEAALKDGTDDGQNQLRASLFDAHGKIIRSDFGLTPHFGGAGGAFSDDENYGYAVAERAGGGFVVANLDWTPSTKDSAGTKGIYFSAYDAKGNAIGASVPIFEKGTVVGDVEMARLTSGQYVVTWNQQSLVAGEIGDDAYAVIVSATGRPVGKVFAVGVDADKYDAQEDVAVAGLTGGGFVITYNSDSIDVDDEGIAGTIYGRGTLMNDTLTVDASGIISGLDGDDVLKGNTQVNTVSGDRGNDILFGYAGADTLSGGVGNDTLIGGTGRDTLTGGLGNDVFHFSARFTSANLATVTDFSNKSGNNDRFEVEQQFVKALGKGVLGKADFVVGSAAKDASDHIIYNKSTGDLSYDANGSKSGGLQIIAKLDAGLSLTSNDFWVV